MTAGGTRLVYALWNHLNGDISNTKGRIELNSSLIDSSARCATFGMLHDHLSITLKIYVFNGSVRSILEVWSVLNVY